VTRLSPKPLVVVKLGGSALTDKRRIYTPHMKEIHRAAKQIAQLRKKVSLVLIHGAGSFGHIPVKRWRLGSGFKNPNQLRGLAVTKSKLLEWELIFTAVFSKNRVPLMPVIASDFVVAQNGRISSVNLSAIKNWLNIGCVPSIGGDIVPDLGTGFSIVSGDQLATYLAIKLKAARLVFGTDVDGVFDTNPKLSMRAKMLTELTASTARSAAQGARLSIVPDVTGGMAGKLLEATAAASKGIPVYFVNMTKNARLTKAVLGQKVMGSRVLPNWALTARGARP
jgi:isopentenyl phosphate kinase